MAYTKPDARNIDRICFTKDGALQKEFGNLYQSLFAEADKHISIVRVLAAKPSGLTRKEIISECGLSTGGTATLLQQELTESGFISAYFPFEKNIRDSIYKLSDEYSRFYLKFLENSHATGTGAWIKLSTAPTWRSWSGTAFESVCLNIHRKLKLPLVLPGLYGRVGMAVCPGKSQPGAQIDLF